MRIVSSLRSFVLIGGLIIAGALSANAQKVRVGADPGVDVAKYKTYAWSQGSTGTNPLVNAMIVTAVDAQMAAKGVRKVDTDAELTLSALVWTDSDMAVSNPSWSPSLNSIATGVAVGTAVAMLPSGCTTVVVGGIGYNQCGSTWYQPFYSGVTVQYISVNPPQ